MAPRTPRGATVEIVVDEVYLFYVCSSCSVIFYCILFMFVHFLIWSSCWTVTMSQRTQSNRSSSCIDLSKIYFRLSSLMAHLVKSEAVVKVHVFNLALYPDPFPLASAFRNILMYGSHFTVCALSVGWFQDTQCGFKVRPPLCLQLSAQTPPRTVIHPARHTANELPRKE